MPSSPILIQERDFSISTPMPSTLITEREIINAFPPQFPYTTQQQTEIHPQFYIVIHWQHLIFLWKTELIQQNYIYNNWCVSYLPHNPINWILNIGYPH